VSKNDFHCRMTKTSFTRYRHEILPAENRHGFNCSHDTGRLYSALTVCCTNQLKIKIDRIKYPTTTFAVLLISFCIP
jgi:hypothetical protein